MTEAGMGVSQLHSRDWSKTAVFVSITADAAILDAAISFKLPVCYRVSL